MRQRSRSLAMRGRGFGGVWTPASAPDLAVWIDPNAANSLKSDEAGTLAATSLVRRVVGRNSLGYASGNPTAANAAVIDMLSYPGATALRLGGGATPFTTLSGVGGTTRAFTLALDFLTTATNADTCSAGLAPSAVGVYESWTGNRYQSQIQRATFGTIAGASSAYWIGRRRLIIRGSASALRVRLNGLDFSEAVLALATHTGGVIGADTAGGLQKPMVLRELLQYSRDLTDAECDSLDAYWLARTAPSASPTGMPLVVCDGNSIVVGSGAGVNNAWPTLMEGIVGRGVIRAVNLGATAFTTANLVTGAATFVDPLYSASRTKNIVIIQEGTNSLIGGATGAATYSNFTTYAAARRAVGWKVLWCNCPPSTSITGAQETERLSLNSSLAANAATLTDGAVINFTAGNFADPANVTYYTDGTHWTATLQTEAAALVATAVNALL